MPKTVLEELKNHNIKFNDNQAKYIVMPLEFWENLKAQDPEHYKNLLATSILLLTPKPL